MFYVRRDRLFVHDFDRCEPHDERLDPDPLKCDVRDQFSAGIFRLDHRSFAEFAMAHLYAGTDLRYVGTALRSRFRHACGT